jgi:hypothetical protein
VAKRKEAQEAKQLVDVKRKLAEMQAELDDLQRAQEEFEKEEKILSDNHTTNQYTGNHSLHHEGYHHHEDHFQRKTYRPSPPPQAFDPSSPLSVTLQEVPWPQGYMPIQLPKYNGSVDPTQWLCPAEDLRIKTTTTPTNPTSSSVTSTEETQTTQPIISPKRKKP